MSSLPNMASAIIVHKYSCMHVIADTRLTVMCNSDLFDQVGCPKACALHSAWSADPQCNAKCTMRVQGLWGIPAHQQFKGAHGASTWMRTNSKLVAARRFAFIANDPAVTSHITWVRPDKVSCWDGCSAFLQAHQVTAQGEQLVEPLWYVLTCLKGWHSTLPIS